MIACLACLAMSLLGGAVLRPAWQQDPAAALDLKPKSNPTELEQILERVSEEAEVFAQLGPKVVGRETLKHRGRKNPPRFRPRVGAAAKKPPKLSYVTKEIVSEYGFAAFKEAPDALREFRQVISLDQRNIRDPDKARIILAANMTSDDDRQRRRMLQDFEKHGMIGAAVDLGQTILLFRRRNLADYEFRLKGVTRTENDEVKVISYRQKGSQESARIYHGRALTRVPLEGDLFVRRSDNIPVRVTWVAAVDEEKVKVRHSAEVDYSMSAHGLLLPVAVRYNKTADGQLMVENLSSYSDYKMFQVEAEIKFTAADEGAGPQLATPQPEAPKVAPPKAGGKAKPPK